MGAGVAMLTITEVLPHLHGAQSRGNGTWVALCPAHDDRNPSLSIRAGDDGRALIHCHAGCTFDAVVAALGLRTNGNGAGHVTARPSSPAKQPRRAAAGRVVATYDYRAADGALLFQKLRYEPKTFKVRRPDGRGGWAWGLGDVRPVLYRLPELTDPANDWQPVHICEGEKDAERVAALGLIATCNHDGAAVAGARPKWRAEYNGFLSGRVVYILADNDDAGQAHAEAVASALYGTARTVKIVALAGLAKHGDVSDWLDAGHTCDELERACLLTPQWERPTAAGALPLGDNGDGDGHGNTHGPSVAAARRPRTDDIGNAERFVAQHSDDVRYDHSSRHWLIWTGTHWRRDDAGAVRELAKQTARRIYAEAAQAANSGQDARATVLSKWAGASAGERRLGAMVNMAATDPAVAVTAAQLNRGDLLLNVQNGTINLATGELRPHDRADLLTYALPVAYDPAATCPTWLRFLGRVAPGLGDYLARAVGYTLSGTAAEQCLLFLYGRGANGKTTFIETIAAIMGDLGHKARAAALMAEAAERIPNEIAALAGKRFVVASELADGGRLNEGLVKDLTGNDAISARFLYGESFTFRPSFVLWLYGNHRPVIVGTDDGIWRRVHLVPFTIQIPAAERDPALPAKLRAELPGILLWAVRGWRDYQARGLGAPEAVTAATADYRAESDILGHFLAERCVVGPTTSARAGELYAEYARWAEASGLRAQSSVKFAAALAERGFAKLPRSNRGNVWQGVGLMAAAEDEGG